MSWLTTTNVLWVYITFSYATNAYNSNNYFSACLEYWHQTIKNHKRSTKTTKTSQDNHKNKNCKNVDVLTSILVSLSSPSPHKTTIGTNHIHCNIIFVFQFTWIDLPNQKSIFDECIKINVFLIFIILIFFQGFMTTRLEKR
jgi:predicted histidine transporter YuiF (NhaC family)